MESKNDAFIHNYKKLVQYYKSSYQQFDFKKNEGAGSISTQKNVLKVQAFINKIGLPPKYGKILYSLIQKENCQHILELGTSIGISTSFLISGKENQQIISIEGNTDIYNVCNQAYAHLGFTQVSLKNGLFENELEACCKQLNQLDFVFIDGNHQKEPTINYFNVILPYLHENSIVVFDDIYWSNEMKEAWQQICKHKKVMLSIDLYRIGIVFFNSNRKEKEHFQLWY